MSFGKVLEHLKAGGWAMRSAWGSRTFLKLQVPDANSKMTLPYLYLKAENDEVFPWVASHEDLLAEDWQAD
jgi:hypothetical protein